MGACLAEERSKGRMFQVKRMTTWESDVNNVGFGSGLSILVLEFLFRRYHEACARCPSNFLLSFSS